MGNKEARFEKPEAIPAIKTFFKAYATGGQIHHYTGQASNPVFSADGSRAVPHEYRTLVPGYVNDYVSLNQFVSQENP